MVNIQRLEIAIIVLSEKVESGEWQGVANEIREILGYNKVEKSKKHEN